MGQPSILLVRNDLLGLELRETGLARHGVQVRPVASEREALDLPPEPGVDLVVLDRESTSLPPADFLKTWQQGPHAKTPVLLLSEDPACPAALAFVAAGGTAVLPRNTSADGIAALLAQQLGLKVRAQPRVQLSVLVKLEMPNVDPALFRSMFATSLDLSAQGVRLEAQHPLPIGTVLKMNMVLPGTGQRLGVRGVVRHEVDADLMHYGLEFQDVDPDTRALLDSFLLARGAP